MQLISERLGHHILGDHTQPSVDGWEIASLLPKWKPLLLQKFVNWMFVREGIFRLYIRGDTKIAKILKTKLLPLRNRESS